MDNLQTNIERYLEYCDIQKRLDEKTLKAYRIDLRQFANHISVQNVEGITAAMLEGYVAGLHRQYKPKTAKRKIASAKGRFPFD